MSTTFTSDAVGQHNKIGGITFGAALVPFNKVLIDYLYAVSAASGSGAYSTLSVRVC
jgi:hypothetical protein